MDYLKFLLLVNMNFALSFPPGFSKNIHSFLPIVAFRVYQEYDDDS